MKPTPTVTPEEDKSPATQDANMALIDLFDHMIKALADAEAKLRETNRVLKEMNAKNPLK